MRSLVFWGVLFLVGAGAGLAAAFIMTHRCGYSLPELFDPSGFKTAVLHYPGSNKSALQAALFGGTGVAVASGFILAATFARLKKAAAG